MSKKYTIQRANIVLFQDDKELTVEYPQNLRITKGDYMYTIEFYNMDDNINIKDYLNVYKLEIHKYGKYEDGSECKIVDTYSGFESLKIIESIEFGGFKTSYKLVYTKSKSKELTETKPICDNNCIKIKYNYFDGFKGTFGHEYIQNSDEINIDINLLNRTIIINDMSIIIPELTSCDLSKPNNMRIGSIK